MDASDRSQDLTIGEVARRTGLRASAIRYYEAVGILPTPRRVSGRRRYGPDVIQTIGVLRFAQQAGCTLSEVRTLLHDSSKDRPLSERWKALAHDKLRELDAVIRRTQTMKQAVETGLACECAGVDDCACVACILPPRGDRRGPHAGVARAQH